jgi:FkbM family methyltransferase
MLSGRVVDILRPWQFRGKQRLLRHITPADGLRRAEVFGYWMELDLYDFIQRTIWVGAYERWETAQVRRLLRPGMTFVDAGANVGYFSLLAASRVGPTGRVLSFEPSPPMLERLRAAVSENRLDHVEIVPAALGAEDAELHLHLPPEGVKSKNHTPSLVPQEGRRRVPVRVRTLDDCLAERGIRRVDVLKVDVEGFEWNVLRGASRSLRSGMIGAVLIELNEDWLARAGSHGGQLVTFLEECGFRLARSERSSANRLFERTR